MAETDSGWDRASLSREAMAYVLDRRPYFTWSLFFITFTAWVLMETFVGGKYGYVGSADVRVLWAAGALDERQVSAGIYDNLFWPIFLYTGIPHYVVNAIGLLLIGAHVERLFGIKRFVLIYAVAGVTGSVASYALYVGVSEGAYSVTGSGPIFGMMGALVAFYLNYGAAQLSCTRRRYPVAALSTLRSTWRSLLDFVPRHVLILLVPILAANVYIGATSEYVDNYTHVAGFLAGTLLAYALKPSYVIDRGFGLVASVRDVSSIWQKWQFLALLALFLVAGTCVGNLS